MAESGQLLRLGVSSCLLGRSVRYDGGHKRSAFVCDQLGVFVEWVPVCPELEAGLGVPRPPMRLVRQGPDLRLLEIESGRDHTQAFERFSRRRVEALRALDLCGYVLKKDSPSCGFERVRIHSDDGPPRREGRGLFAAALCQAFPKLPIEDEARLDDPHLRENFIARVLAFRRALRHS
jgi:uncharacterized protein YbbK (DUF523 family)